MSFTKEHWKNPRNTIACVYQNNDMAYATHGIKSALDFMKYLDLNLSQLSDKSILEYGCGTAKNLRPLTYIFNKCVGYDPVKECIDVGNQEVAHINKKDPNFPRKVDLIHNMKLTYNINEIINEKFDYVVAIDVFQHLTQSDGKEALDNMLKMTREYCIFNNPTNMNFSLKEYNVIQKNCYYIIKK